MTTPEITFPKDKTLKKGNTGLWVKRVQEWLCYHGMSTTCDGEFGPATALCVSNFRKTRKLTNAETVDEGVFAKLCEPMKLALDPFPPTPTYNTQVVAVAKRHFALRPREYGGDNCGMWVRLYCRGDDGKDYRWCAGFDTTIHEIAAEMLGVDPVIDWTLSCDEIAEKAKSRGKFVKGADGSASKQVQPGDLFLCVKPGPDWFHTGIVVRVDKNTFATIEGNTNDDGNSNGYEVCSRIRSFGDHMDFARI